jgi:GT2 family glycosyltransferase
VTDLSIVVVTWNTRELALRCLAAALRAAAASGPRLACELVVVDNGSRDGTPEAVRELFPTARLLALPHNLGFAAGANRGLAAARGRHALLLNSDAWLLPGSIARAVAYLDAHPDVGVVGPCLLRPDGRRRANAHRYPRVAGELLPAGLLALPRRLRGARAGGRRPAEVEAVRGAALFLRRDLLRRVGALPEHYFFFLEETDWCWRVRAAGLRVVLLPGARAVHLSGASSARLRPSQTRIEYHRSLYRFLLRHRGVGRTAVVWMLRFAKTLARVVCGAPLSLVSSRLRSRWRVERDVLAWHLRGCPAGAGLAGAAMERP